MHHHVRLLGPAFVAAQTANQAPDLKRLAKAYRERCYAQHGRVLSLEADRAVVEAGAHFVAEHRGRSFLRLRHAADSSRQFVAIVLAR
jgi:hypothetical protein